LQTPIPESAIREAPLILFVDDSADDRELYIDYLAAAGFRVAAATDGSQGVALAKSMAPDLIVMDLHMPGIDGWEAACLLAGNKHTHRIPIVALSGACDTAAVMRAVSSGCDGFVLKPCLAGELEGIIRSTLEKERVRQEALRTAADEG